MPGERCEGGLRERLVEAGQIRVAPGGATLPGLEEVDEVSVNETGSGLAITARRDTTVAAFVIVAADGGTLDVPDDLTRSGGRSGARAADVLRGPDRQPTGSPSTCCCSRGNTIP